MNSIKTHLTINGVKTTDGHTIESYLSAALKDARKFTGRLSETGFPNPNNTFRDLGSWGGAMCYMTILEQIGKCYRPKSKKKVNTDSPIETALTYFSSLNNDEINAVVALRNAFFHDFGLHNKNNSNPKRQHVFTVTNHPTDPVVRLPKIQWDGLMNTRKAENTTTINLKALGDLVEGIYKDLISLELNNKLELELTGGEPELFDRYMITY
jgi:hypothetical protein